MSPERTTAPIFGLVTPRRFLVVLLLLASVVLAIWYVTSADRKQTIDPEFGVSSGIDEPRSSDLETGLVSTDPDRQTEGLPGVVAVSENEAESYRRALGGLRGRLIWDHTREPIPGVEIRVVEVWLDSFVPTMEDVAATQNMREPLFVKATVRTDGEGRFEVRGLHSRATLFLAIGLGTDKAALRLVTNVPHAGETADLGDVALLERGTVRGRVVIGDTPVAGARVRIVDLPNALAQIALANYEPEALVILESGAFHSVIELPAWVKKYDRLLPYPEATTDAEGRFVLEGVRPGSSTLLVRHRGFVPVVRPQRVRPGADSIPSDIKLSRGLSLRGRCLDADGKPNTSVRVTAGVLMPIAPFGFLQPPTPVDAQGEFELVGLPRGKLRFCYQLATGEPWIVEGQYLGGETIELRTAPLREIGLRVVDEQSWPVRDVQLSISASAEAGYLPGFERRFDASSHVRPDPRDKDRLIVYALPAAKYKVVARAAGFAVGTTTLDLAGEEQSADVTLKLARGIAQRFEARDVAGRPVESARVYWSAPQALSGLPVLIGKTDATGSLTSGAIVPGVSRFLCRHPGFALAFSGDQAVTQGATVRFVLKPCGHIEGRLTENGQPPAGGATLIARAPQDLAGGFGAVMTSRLVHVMPDGSFRLRNLDPGMWTLDVVEEFDGRDASSNVLSFYEGFGKRRARREVLVTASRTSNVTIDLVERGSSAGDATLSGTVRLGGKPGVGVLVEARRGASTKRGEVDASGQYEITKLEAGEHRVRVLREGSMLAHELWTGEATLIASSRSTLDVDLSIGSLDLTLADPDGTALTAMLVTIRGERLASGNTRGIARFRAITNSAGVAEYRDVPAGSYEVFLSDTRNAVWALPETKLDVPVSLAPTRRNLRVVRAPKLDATIEWDVSALTEGDQSLANANRLEHLVFESSGRFVWGKIRERDGQSFVEIDPIAPGTWRLVKTGLLAWSCERIHIPSSGLSGGRIVLRPDAARVTAARSSRDPRINRSRVKR